MVQAIDPRYRQGAGGKATMVQVKSSWSVLSAAIIYPLRSKGGHRGRPICRSNNWTRNRITFILITRRGQATKRNARSEVGSAPLPNPSTSCVISPRAPPRTHLALLFVPSFAVRSSWTPCILRFRYDRRYNRNGVARLNFYDSSARAITRCSIINLNYTITLM